MTSPAMKALRSRVELEQSFSDNALILFALETRFAIDDIETAAASCLTDGPRDRKCDAVYIDKETATAVIAQGYRTAKNSSSAPSNKAADLNSAVSWILSRDYARMNESLQAAAADLNQAIESGEIDSIELWYSHNLPESKNVQEELDRAAATATSLISTVHPESELSVQAIEVGTNKLDEWYASIQNPILVADELVVNVDGWFEEVGDGWTAVCVSIPASWLVELHQTYSDKLFSANVRGYMPSRKTARNINNNIETTAREKPGRFWAYNNGITALVHGYETPKGNSGGPLVLSGIAIVNGAQTTGALSRSDGNVLANANVLARFITAEDDEIVDEIIRYNNSQNPIKPSDFRSTDRHQDRLRRQFKSIPDAIYYGTRRGGQNDRARRPGKAISSDTVAQSLAAFHGQAGVAYHQLRSIWENDETYSKYFSESTTAQHVVFVYSLLLAIQNAKTNLVQRSNRDELAEDETELLAVFRQRGSQFLLVSSVAACIEILLDRPVSNRFSLSFGQDVSPAQGQYIWESVLATMLPFASCLRAEELKGSLRNETRVNEAIRTFRQTIRSTERGHKVLFSEFAAKIQGN